MEQVHIRINDHQILDGVKDYSVEIAMPGKYVKTFIGASQEEFAQAIVDSFKQIFTLIGIPESKPESQDLAAVKYEQFTDFRTGELLFRPVLNEKSDGNNKPGFHAKAKATFNAQVIRDGKVVED
jgi:hypothetical protein